MAQFTEEQIDLITKARKIIHREAVEGGAMNWDRFSDFRGLVSFVNAGQFSGFLDHNLDLTRGALRNVTARLSAAHTAAAGVTVGEVPAAVVADFVAKLRAVHEDVQADQGFRVASQMAGDLATAIEAHAQG